MTVKKKKGLAAVKPNREYDDKDLPARNIKGKGKSTTADHTKTKKASLLASNPDMTKRRRPATTSTAKKDESPPPTITKRSVPSSLLADLERLTPKRTTRQTSKSDTFHRETLLAAYSGSDTDEDSRKPKRPKTVAKKLKKTSRSAKPHSSGPDLEEIESEIIYRAVGVAFEDTFRFYRKLVEKIVHLLLNPIFIGKNAEFDFASQHLSDFL
ncbi:hypothetical protein GLAREA_08000 [Glarea lozoyensis ATCC 20868]|uniref:Uncharacterized protein n=1 Tax=Glarea lozoyensis (strain ATCC 20868 / MF5171) TaxID=1116229 RepID=S3CDQ9_GLAL2|nr:uncharacterized protein GLAREA_08000 [Glarea lozoyensis ATCC 20868]EPE24150.1 hypothetical protein GLAREA_08000 [Glarea lozoyensis ATCC 20868]